MSLSVLALFLCYTAWNFSISNFDSVTQDMTMQVTETRARLGVATTATPASMAVCSNYFVALLLCSTQLTRRLNTTTNTFLATPPRINELEIRTMRRGELAGTDAEVQHEQTVAIVQGGAPPNACTDTCDTPGDPVLCCSSRTLPTSTIWHSSWSTFLCCTSHTLTHSCSAHVEVEQW